MKRRETFHPSFEDVEIKVARQFFRVLNLISAIGLPSVCREDTEARYRCFPSGEHQTGDAKKRGTRKRRRKFFVEMEERKRELRLWNVGCDSNMHRGMDFNGFEYLLNAWKIFNKRKIRKILLHWKANNLIYICFTFDIVILSLELHSDNINPSFLSDV